MSDDAGSGCLLILVLIGAGAWFAYSGVGYTTGKTWFEGCYDLKVAHKGFEEPIAKDAHQAAFWKTCEPISRRAIFSQGILFFGRNDLKPLTDSCPSSWSDLPVGGTYLLSLSFVEAAGGVSISDYFLPAETMIGRLYSQRWPNCARVATQFGYPKLIESKTAPGTFEWSEPCKPCKAEEK